MQVRKARRYAAWLGVAAGLWLAPAPEARAQAPVTIRAVLILASDRQAAQDPRLDLVEYKLRRMFRFEYYRHYGEGSAAVPLPGQATLELGRGFRLKLSASSAGKGQIRAGVHWLRGDEVVLNTAVAMNPGIPVILGGISHEGGTLIVTLTAE